MKKSRLAKFLEKDSGEKSEKTENLEREPKRVRCTMLLEKIDYWKARRVL
jgi:hypothetical protein